MNRSDAGPTPGNGTVALTAGAWARTWLRLHQRSLRHLWVVGGLCFGIAVLLTALDGRGFGTKLVYSF